MANTDSLYTPVNGNMTLGLRAMSMSIVSTLLMSCPILAAMALMDGNKSSNMGFQGVGTPDAQTILSGAEISPIKAKEIDECDQYNPLLEAIYQADGKTMSLPSGNGAIDTNPTLSVATYAGTATLATALTLVMSNGTVGTVSLTAGGTTTLSGSLPTLVVVDATGSSGYGAVLQATSASGTLTGATILSAGSGYGAATCLINAGYTAGTKFARPAFRWTHRRDPGYIREHDVDRARALARGNESYFHSKMNDIISAEQKRVVSGQIQKMEVEFQYGSPSDDTATLWDSQYGLSTAVADTGVYGGVDRSITSNYWWRARKDTGSHVFTLQALWNDAHLTKGLMANGGQCDVFIVHPNLLAKFLRESDAYTQNANTDPNVQMLKGTFGYKYPVVKYNSTYVIGNWRQPVATVYGLNMATWIVAFKSGRKWTTSEIYPQKAVEGGKAADLFYVDSQYMAICEAPGFGNIQYSAVS